MGNATSADGTVIEFDKVGSGPPLVLVGGTFQYRAFDPRTQELADLLGEDFTVYHYDRRGRGGSTDTPPYAVERELEDLAALIADAGGEAHLFGMSAGTVLALDAAARSGSGVTKVATYEPPFITDDTRPRPSPAFLPKLTALIEDDRRADAVELYLAESFGAPPERIAEMKASPLWPGFLGVAPTLVYDSILLGDGSLPEGRWAALDQPVLVLDGGASPASFGHAAQALADALPNARRRTLPDQEHAVAPDVLTAALREFYLD